VISFRVHYQPINSTTEDIEAAVNYLRKGNTIAPTAGTDFDGYQYRRKTSAPVLPLFLCDRSLYELAANQDENPYARFTWMYRSTFVEDKMPPPSGPPNGGKKKHRNVHMEWTKLKSQQIHRTWNLGQQLRHSSERSAAIGKSLHRTEEYLARYGETTILDTALLRASKCIRDAEDEAIAQWRKPTVTNVVLTTWYPVEHIYTPRLAEPELYTSRRTRVPTAHARQTRRATDRARVLTRRTACGSVGAWTSGAGPPE
jgi:hypothetical protein